MRISGLTVFIVIAGSLIASFFIPVVVGLAFPIVLLPFTIWITAFNSFISYGTLLLLIDKPDPSWSPREQIDFSFARVYYPFVLILSWAAAIVLWLSILGIKF